MTDNPPIEHPVWLTTGDFTQADEPFALFAGWLKEATASESRDPNAMAVATVDADGLPDVRMVLMKGFDRNGFVFYTNMESTKGHQLAEAPRAALLFHWKTLNRQVRVRGPAEVVTEAEADAYFASRARLSRIGAWASKQSQPLESRLAFEKAVALYTAKFGTGTIPRPPHWSGFRIIPHEIEFWADRPFRLHDRIVFRRERPGEPWTRTRLYP
ncbi:MAG: pyridoxamine 5'-phosphate oxidase [Pseudorhodoplanes sp.]|nr:Pyridoxine/pyridoxamine 5'-phosphate oxidase [Pseudorhodoplanes sp.]MCQ3942026.1 pyridoxamine 5'-phosphate oxidase [Alphaproteobacteria bacterium]MBW7948619.1 pyridoxamine 5'-phosphate oxidase [Pseudorhodoplanes sp.]MCL4711932.1 pyridoxamine 5'-phosphate oxidase [Pseudorhodoplanes sp.]MCZ7642155.1 pyridoxamine 5'-phosphate oxidase [Pseudorhodoplanes sp.]